MPIWYKIRRKVWLTHDIPCTQIDEVQVVRDTEKSVFLPNKCGNDRREAKVTEYYSYHPTKAEAKAQIRQLTQKCIQNANRTILAQQDRIGRLERQLKELEDTFVV